MKKITIVILIGLFFAFTYVFASPTYEDFTTYTEVDPSGWISTSTASTTLTSLSWNADAYCYYDYGVDHFNGDFEHLLVVRWSVYTAMAGHWELANELDDLKGLRSAGKSFFNVQIYGTDLNLWETDSGTIYQDSWLDPALNTTYYLKIKRDESVGTYGTLYTYIYSDSARTTLVDTLTLTLHTSKKDFRYLYSASSYNDGSTGTYVTGWCGNLDLQEAAPPAAAPPPQPKIIIIE